MDFFDTNFLIWIVGAAISLFTFYDYDQSTDDKIGFTWSFIISVCTGYVIGYIFVLVWMLKKLNKAWNK